MFEQRNVSALTKQRGTGEYGVELKLRDTLEEEVRTIGVDVIRAI